MQEDEHFVYVKSLQTIYLEESFLKKLISGDFKPAIK